MVFKRPFSEGEGEVVNQEAKRRITSSNFAQDLICGLSSQELALSLEPFLRRVVRDEVQRSCQRFFSTLPRYPINALEQPCNKTSLQLHFLANLPNTFFTGSRIESENNTPMKLVLFDVNTNKIVSNGPFSSLKVEIIPLDGDFLVDDEQDWAKKDFDDKIICARDGRRPLITGDLVITLQNGIAELNDLSFTDNSSWRRSRKFMVGARVKDTSNEMRIREARSQAFIVKDHRGESYKKHHPPSLNDEIWRLEKIAKDGVFHERLASHRVHTVKDFLQMYVTNESLLRKLLGRSSNKTWETIIKHAKECVLDDKLYMHTCGPDGIGLVLDSVLTVVGATFDAQNYLPLDKLSMFQMPVVENLKQQVYEKLNGMVPIDEASVFGVPINRQHDLSKNANLGVNIPLVHQDEVEMQMYGLVNGSNEMEVGMKQDPYSMGYFSPALRNSFIIKEFGYDQDVADDINFQIGTSLWQENEVFINQSNQTVDIVSSDFGICFSRNGSPRARWCKIKAALKWDSVRRDVAAKKVAQMHSFLDFYVQNLG